MCLLEIVGKTAVCHSTPALHANHGRNSHTRNLACLALSNDKKQQCDKQCILNVHRDMFIIIFKRKFQAVFSTARSPIEVSFVSY
jgi:hypothetical protein